MNNWDRGIYSIVRFELTKLNGGTKLIFDHTAFPKGDAEHLAAGWRAHYWEPMQKLLSRAEKAGGFRRPLAALSC